MQSSACAGFPTCPLFESRDASLKVNCRSQAFSSSRRSIKAASHPCFPGSTNTRSARDALCRRTPELTDSHGLIILSVGWSIAQEAGPNPKVQLSPTWQHTLRNMPMACVLVASAQGTGSNWKEFAQGVMVLAGRGLAGVQGLAADAHDARWKLLARAGVGN